MKESLHFTYDGVYSGAMGVIQVSSDSGLFEESFMASRSIRETKTKGRSQPFLNGVTYDPFEFDLTLFFDNGFDDAKLREVKRWLCQDRYKEFYTELNPETRYFAMATGESSLKHNGAGQGYIQLHFRCDDAFSYSSEYLDDVIDLSTNPVEGTLIEFENKGDIELKPEIQVELVSGNSFKFVNESNGGQIMEFNDLAANEIVYIDCMNEDIVSDIPGVYRYENMSGDYLTCVYGVNRIRIFGNVKVQMRYRYRFVG